VRSSGRYCWQQEVPFGVQLESPGAASAIGRSRRRYRYRRGKVWRSGRHRETVGSRRRSLKKRFKSCFGFAAEAASESLFRAPRERSTQPLSGSTAKRSSRESLSRSLRITFPAKTSSGEAFSGSRCYQTLYLKTIFRRANHHGRVVGVGFPSSEFSGPCK
jgi:hypothetical protein